MEQQEHEVRFAGRIQLLRFLSDKPAGFFISYPELGEILGRDPQGKGRADILWVRYRLLSERSKWFEVDAGKGYFIAESNKHDGAANRYDSHAQKKQRIAVTIAAHTDTTKLTPDELRTLNNTQFKLAMKYLVGININKAKPEGLQSVRMPTNLELLEIYRNRKNGKDLPEV